MKHGRKKKREEKKARAEGKNTEIRTETFRSCVFITTFGMSVEVHSASSSISTGELFPGNKATEFETDPKRRRNGTIIPHGVVPECLV
jgi:hypothetical protein